MKNNVISLSPKKTEKKRYVELSDDEKSDLQELGLNSFVTEYKRLRKKVMSDDFASNEAAYQLLRAQLAATIRAIGVMDKAFIKSSGRNAYGYVALHTLAKDLMQELRIFGDQSETISKIRNEVVQPLLSNLATQVVSSLLSSRKKLNTQLNDKNAKIVYDELKRIQESLADLFSKAEGNAIEKLVAILNSKS